MHSFGAADRVVVLPSARRYHARINEIKSGTVTYASFSLTCLLKYTPPLASRFTRPVLVPTVQPFAVQIRRRARID